MFECSLTQDLSLSTLSDPSFQERTSALYVMQDPKNTTFVDSAYEVEITTSADSQKITESHEGAMKIQKEDPEGTQE